MIISHPDETSDARLCDILEAALAAKAPNREGCRYLLGFPAHSLEAGVLRGVANAINRRRFDNAGLVLGQIGVHIRASAHF